MGSNILRHVSLGYIRKLAEREMESDPVNSIPLRMASALASLNDEP